MKIEKLFLFAFSFLWLVACYQILLFVRVQASSNTFSIFSVSSQEDEHVQTTAPEPVSSRYYDLHSFINNWSTLNFISCPNDILEFLQEWTSLPYQSTKSITFSNWDSCLSDSLARTQLEKFISSLHSKNIQVQLNWKDSQLLHVSFIDASVVSHHVLLLEKTSDLIVVFEKNLKSSSFETREHLEDTASKLDSFMDTRTQWTVFMEPFFVNGVVMQEITTTYLPVDLQIQSQLFILYKRKSKTLKKIQDLQFPPNCQVVDRSPEIGGKMFLIQPLWNRGYGSYIFRTAFSLEFGYSYNRTVIIDGEWTKYIDPSLTPECPNNSPVPQCYFMSYTLCTGLDALTVWRNVTGKVNSSFWKIPESEQDPHRDIVMHSKDNILTLIHLDLPKGNTSSFVNNMVEWGYDNLFQETMHTEDQTEPFLYLLQRRRRWVREKVFLKKQKAAIPEEYISLHVRHGDKWVENEVVPFPKYMELLEYQRNFVWNTTITNIFLATDDKNVIEESKNYTQYQFCYLEMSRSSGKQNYMFSSEQARNKKETFLDVLVELEILSNGKFFVGSDYSNYSMLAMKKFYYRKKAKDHFRTKDYPDHILVHAGM